MQSKRLFTTLTAAPSKSASANRVLEICEQEVAPTQWADMPAILEMTAFVRKSFRCAIFVLLAMSCIRATAQEKVLYTFSFGSGPDGGLIADAAGNLYGTTSFGGQYGHGSVFELSPPVQVGKRWTEKTLYSFSSVAGTDLFEPEGCLVFDKLGNLYGTTVGAPNADPGGVFELSPSGTGTWTESILHIFSNSTSDGWYPETGLIIDSAGKLYGTTYQGGTSEVGVVFQLVPPTGGGAWTENLIHVFTGASDGGYPTSRLLLKSGHLYGEVSWNGKNFGGLVYELTSGAGVCGRKVFCTPSPAVPTVEARLDNLSWTA